ncbi:hypothetical protein NDU88_006337 [Pleurodeles waltl]|uniref:Uncharacterized protein n=1 Tax=Pleurodeles waltl TaxID=8319 RepID=A0AAV7SPB2_PLEWA|nr:hypothetical protein NDU88_006337 [Pleurodeles waltl]
MKDRPGRIRQLDDFTSPVLLGGELPSLTTDSQDTPRGEQRIPSSSADLVKTLGPSPLGAARPPVAPWMEPLPWGGIPDSDPPGRVSRDPCH